MFEAEDITDPGDWDSTNFPKLNELDSMLRCLICKDLLNSPVLTTCGHIFCSMCARRSISESNKCPLCLEETYESGLRKVLLLDGIVDWFSKNREDLMKHLTKDVSEVDNSQSENDEVVNSGANGESECPVCGELMPLSELEKNHIDLCLKRASEPQPTKKRKVGVTDLFSKIDTKSKRKNSSQVQSSLGLNKQRLANLDTSLTTNKLKAKLLSLHLPSNGNRRQLENRLKEYITLYNANLDSLNPVHERILIDRLSKWEYLMNRTIKSDSPDHEDHNQSYDKERKLWQEKNNNEYLNLIAQAKKGKRTIPNNEEQLTESGRKTD